MTDMNCSFCGMPVDEGDRFCQNCGKPIQSENNAVEVCENSDVDVTQNVENETYEAFDVTRAVGDEDSSVGGNDNYSGSQNYYNSAQRDTYSEYQNYYNNHAQNTSSGGKGVYIVLIALLVALIMGAVGFLAYMIMGGSSTGGSNAATFVPMTVAPSTPAPTQVPTPVFVRAEASSTRGTDSEGGKYSKDAIMSNDPMTKWVPSKNSGNGVGQWVQISADSTQYVRGVKILNGYHKNANTWSNNNRVNLCTISFSNGESKDFNLPDTMDMITLNFPTPIATTYVRLTIKSVYYGARWNDTAVTYFGAF